MNTAKLPALCLSTVLLPACVIVDDENGPSTTTGIEDALVADTQTALTDLAAVCNYYALYFTNQEAAPDFADPPTGSELYTVTDECLVATEETLIALGMTLDFDGPLLTDPIHRTAIEGVHSLLFSPMFMPPPAMPGGVPSVYAVDTADYPYPETLASVLPVVPPSFEHELSPGSFNVAIATSFVTIVSGISDQTASGDSASARFEGGTIILLDGFPINYLGDAQATAALFAHEAAHEYTYGHKACDVQPAMCDPAPSELDDDCDCDYELSAYWVEAAFAEAAALGRSISFFPGASDPIDGGTAVGFNFPAQRCEDTRDHVNPFRFSRPQCSTINQPLIQMIEANSSYWEGL